MVCIVSLVVLKFVRWLSEQCNLDFFSFWRRKTSRDFYRTCACMRVSTISVRGSPSIFLFFFCANKISVKNAIDFSNFFLCPCPSLSGHICFFRYFPVAFCCRGIDLPVYKQSHVFHEPTLIVDVSILSVSVSCQSQPTAKNILRCFLVSYDKLIVFWPIVELFSLLGS